MVFASPTKLRSGGWGVRVHGKVAEGDVVEVHTRAGKTWSATIERVLWTGRDDREGRDVSLCATARRDQGSPTPGGRRRTRSCRRCGCTDATCVRGGLCSGPDFDPCFDCR